MAINMAAADAASAQPGLSSVIIAATIGNVLMFEPYSPKTWTGLTGHAASERSAPLAATWVFGRPKRPGRRASSQRARRERCFARRLSS
jgi:hypothetical protein